MTLVLLFTVLTSAHAFEACTDENSYLEALLPEPVSTPFTGLAQTCIETAHLSLSKTGYYGFCPTPEGSPGRTHVRPCVSEKYVTSVHTTLLDVTDCFGYDPRLAFASFNLESALHLNAVSAGTDVGIGQLTKSAIDEVNQNALERARRIAKAGGKDSCRRLLPFMTEHGSAADQRCGFMSLPENPTRNLVYSVLLLQQNRRVVNNLWNKYSIMLPAEIDSERLKTFLTMLGYNAGPGGVVTTLKAYVDQMTGVTLTERHFHFQSPDADSFIKYLADYFPSKDEAVRKRVSKYIGYILVAARRVDGLSGGTGACLHPYYENPAAPPGLPGAPADAALAKTLVERYTRDLALSFASKQDFEFAFGGRRDDLPDYLAEIYRKL